MKVLCIINPAAGKDFPVLAVMNRFFREHKIDWSVYVTETENYIEGDFDAVVSYGGDGTLTKYLPKCNCPVLPLHGGTGNVIAKELKIPTKLEDAMQLLLDGTAKSFDSFTLNSKERFLRAYTGPPAKTLKNVNREDKNKIGLAAYIEAIARGTKYEPKKYLLKIDNKEKQIETNLLLITNFSTIGFAGLKIDQKINPNDGVLNLISVNDPIYISRNHWQFKKLRIKTDKKTVWSIDDDFQETDEIEIEVKPNSCQLITL